MHAPSPRLVALLATLLAACSGSGGDVYDDLAVDETLTAPGLSAPAHIVVDRYGIPHVHARSIDDAAFASGWVTARDRWAQLELFRHVAGGRLSEIFGLLEPAQIDEDLRMRTHRMRPLAEETWTLLQASADPIDEEVVRTLERYADGVNHYLDQLRSGEVVLDADVEAFLPDPENIDPWTPVDTLTIGRLLTYTLSFNDFDLELTAVLDASLARFDAADPGAAPALARRAGSFFDLYDLTPLDATAPSDGFPNVAADGGSRAAAPGAPRPAVDRALLTRARAALAPPALLGSSRAPGTIGSNNWVVGPGLAGGATLLANDPHLPLSNPPFWYLVHVTVPGVLDVQGAAFPGIPGVLLGHNAHVAWGATVAYHDVNDYYLEDLRACGGGLCARFEGADVPLEAVNEELTIGTLGIPFETRTVTYLRVPHHGPLVPEIVDHALVAPGAGPALSIRYVGHEPSFEIRAFLRLQRARTRAEAFAALGDYAHGAMNWVVADADGDFGWTTSARIPRRSAGCFGFSPARPTAAAPFLVVPGDGSCEWGEDLDPRYVPHAIAPARGYVATANGDPVGETFDGDALDGPVVDGRPLYVGALYDVGYRIGRIVRLLEEARATEIPITTDDLARIQGDHRSNLGEALRPAIVAALGALAAELATPGTRPDLSAFAAALSAGDRAALADAGARLAGWSLDTPTGEEGADAATLADAVATTLFNAWLVRFIAGAFGDELAEVEITPTTQFTTRTAVKVLARPATLRTGLAPETGEAVLCDDLATPVVVESCTLVVVRAMHETIVFARERFASEQPEDWTWGTLHTVRLAPLTPQRALGIPAVGGLPRPGDHFSVDVANPGVSDDDFTYGHGASMRHLVRFDERGPTAWMALPGGQVFDPTSPHFADLMEGWRMNQLFEIPWTPDQIIGASERHVLIE